MGSGGTSEPPEELKQRLPHDPRLWARNYLRHPNDPSREYDFWDDVGPPPSDYDGDIEDWDGNYLYYLTDDDGPMRPQNWGDINVLLFARGCLKTWTTTSIASWALDMYPSLEIVATAPVDDQRGEVIDRFKTKAKQSGLVDRRVKDNMGHQKFENTAVDPETGESYPAYSHLKSRSAWNEGDKLRGLHAHAGIIDESQDVDEGTFSTFLEAIDREVPQVNYFPSIFVIGTPKMANTFFHRLWRMSDQKTWDGDNNEWVVQADADEFLPEEMQTQVEDLEEKIEELDDKIADAEDHGNDSRVDELTALRDEFEDELDDISGFTVRGWHVDQYNSPIHDDQSIAFKKETYSKRKFKNEVEAQFFSPENDLITNDDVWERAFVDDERQQPEPRYEDTVTVLGVDWGGGQGEGAAKTVVGVAELAADGETLEVCTIGILDSSLSSAEERERIDTLMQQYSVDIGVVDEGFGDTDREELQDEYGYDDSNEQSVYGCWYGNVKDKEEIKWNRFNNEKRFFTTSKVFMAKNMAEDFKAGRIRIPSADLSFDSKQSDGTRIVEQLTAPYTEKKETRGGKTKVEIVADRNDDVFDVLTYCWIAAHKVQTTRSIRSVGGHTRAGY